MLLRRALVRRLASPQHACVLLSTDSHVVDGVLSSLPTLLFDLDGTLVNTLPDLASALNHIVAAHASTPLTHDDVRPMIGDGVPVLVERALRRVVLQEREGIVPGDAADAADADAADLVAGLLDASVADFHAYYNAHCAVDSVLYDGVEATLAALQKEGWPLGVCTNKPVVPAQAILDELGIAGYFGAAVVGGDSLPVRKPHAGPLLHAVACAGGDLDAPVGVGAVMVGDGSNDVKGARAAGFPVVAVSYGYTSSEELEAMRPDAMVGGFGELRAVLERWRVDGRDANRSM
jgi:phosphoglycolate phosphatase